MKTKPTPKRRTRVTAAPGESLEQNYSQDPQVHRPELRKQEEPDAAPPRETVDTEAEVKTSPAVEVTKYNDHDDALSSPLRYVVSVPDAAEKMEGLIDKIQEAAPDLSDRLETLRQGVQEIERISKGGEAYEAEEVAEGEAPAPGAAAPASQAGEAPTQYSPGDRVMVETEDGQAYVGSLMEQNEDGTWEIQTDDNMNLHQVAEADLQVAPEEEAKMMLPASKKKTPGKMQAKTLMAEVVDPADEVSRDTEESMTATETGETLQTVNKKPDAPAKKPGKEGEDVEAAAKGRAKKSRLKASDDEASATCAVCNKTFKNIDDPSAITCSDECWAKYTGEDVKASKKAKATIVEASAFDEIDQIDIGGGMIAKRKSGEAKEGEEATPEIEVVDKDGKTVATYPDAFGDDTAAIIKLLRQIHNISEKDDKKAAKEEGGSQTSDKPKALPKLDKGKDEEKGEKKEKAPKKSEKDETEELEAARKGFEQRIQMVRGLVAGLVTVNHVTADQKDIDTFLHQGMTLTASMDEAVKVAADRKFRELLALPDAELLSLKASLPNLQTKVAQVEIKASIEGLEPLNLLIQAAEGSSAELSIGSAFGRGFGTR